MSVIVDTFYRPEMLKHAIQCLRDQTYPNLEIVIVNNGATAETISYLAEIEKIEKRVKLVHFETNQFSWDDPHMIVRVCLNAGLDASTGELVFHQSDDDWVAIDFLERMVALFVENPECTTAKGRCISVMPDGTKIPYPLATRARHIAGIELALDYLNGNKRFKQTDPGSCFVMLKSELLKLGGFHSTYEFQQYFSLLPFGITGYDPDALMYWRRHECQLNQIAIKQGTFWGIYTQQLLGDSRNSVIPRWRTKFGDEKAAELKTFLLDHVSKEYFRVIAHRMFHFHFLTALRFIRMFLNSEAKSRINSQNFYYGAYLGMCSTPFGLICIRCANLFKGMLLRPVETTRKILRRIWK